MTVDGAGSALLNSGLFNFFVGNHGSGTLIIRGGGLVRDGSASVGSNAAGSVTVDGAGSTWTNTGDLSDRRGRQRHAHHQQRRRGEQCAGGTHWRWSRRSTGRVTVDGAGSTWTNSGTLSVGDSGGGTLTIRTAARSAMAPAHRSPRNRRRKRHRDGGWGRLDLDQ